MVWRFMVRLVRRILRRTIFGPPSAVRIARNLVNHTAVTAFRVFRDEEVRTSLKFKKIEKGEQDRIFNEFLVTGLALISLMMEMLAQMSEGKRKTFFREVQSGIKARLLQWFRELGTAEHHVDLWDKLIEMRLDEYREDRLRYRDNLPEPGEGNPWFPIVATGGLFHVRRGKPLSDDPVFRHMRAWLSMLAMRTEKVMISAIERL